MSLTMTDEQERARRKRLASSHVLMSGECFCANCGAIAFKCELDATREKLAEAEQNFDKAANAYEAQSDEYLARLAAAQAECVELRALVADALPMSDGAAVDCRDDGFPKLADKHEAVSERIRLALSRAPGSREALRAMLERAAAFAWDRGWDAARDEDDTAIVKRDVEDVVARLLGGAADAKGVEE